MVNYTYQGDEDVAKALATRRAISTKYSVEICSTIKGKKVEAARKILEDAADKKNAIRFTRFTNGAGHKSGIGPGKYPVKAAKAILKVLNSAEANAQNKGMGSDLIVLHAAANEAARSYKYGRKSRRQEKSTHVEIIVKESEQKKREAKQAPKKKTKEEKKE